MTTKLTRSILLRISFYYYSFFLLPRTPHTNKSPLFFTESQDRKTEKVKRSREKLWREWLWFDWRTDNRPKRWTIHIFCCCIKFRRGIGYKPVVYRPYNIVSIAWWYTTCLCTRGECASIETKGSGKSSRARQKRWQLPRRLRPVDRTFSSRLLLTTIAFVAGLVYVALFNFSCP